MEQEPIANPVTYVVTNDENKTAAELRLNPKVIKEFKQRRRIGEKLFLLLQEFITVKG